MTRTQKISKIKQIRFDVPDKNATIWRYMDFTEFVDILSNGGLFFARVDKLGDDFEGSCPKANLKYRLDTFKKLIGG